MAYFFRRDSAYGRHFIIPRGHWRGFVNGGDTANVVHVDYIYTTQTHTIKNVLFFSGHKVFTYSM